MQRERGEGGERERERGRECVCTYPDLASDCTGPPLLVSVDIIGKQ